MVSSLWSCFVMQQVIKAYVHVSAGLLAARARKHRVGGLVLGFIRADGARAYVTNAGSNSVSVIDTRHQFGQRHRASWISPGQRSRLLVHTDKRRIPASPLSDNP